MSKGTIMIDSEQKCLIDTQGHSVTRKCNAGLYVHFWQA